MKMGHLQEQRAYFRSQDSIVSIVARQCTGQLRNFDSIASRDRRVSASEASKMALGPTQPSVFRGKMAKARR